MLLSTDFTAKCELVLRPNTQKQPPQVFYKNRCFKNFSKFTGKYLCQSCNVVSFQKRERWKRKVKNRCEKIVAHYCYCLILNKMFAFLKPTERYDNQWRFLTFSIFYLWNKREKLFENSGIHFLIESTTVENTTFPYKTFLDYVKINEMGV